MTMPRQPHEPTDQSRRSVESMIAYGVPQSEVAAVVGIDAKTLRKHYRQEIDTASTKATARVGEFLYQAASGAALSSNKSKATYADCVRAAIFWLKTRGGWKEGMVLEHTGRDGAPIATEAKLDVRGLSDAVLAEIASVRGSILTLSDDEEDDA